MGEIENRLRAARAYADLDQDAFAVHLETSKATIQRIEGGARAIDPEKDRYLLERASKATGLPVAFFIADFSKLETAGSLLASRSDSPDEPLKRELHGLAKQLEGLSRVHQREVEKLARSTAYDRGRMTRIEKNLNDLGQVLLEDLEKRNGRKRP